MILSGRTCGNGVVGGVEGGWAAWSERIESGKQTAARHTYTCLAKGAALCVQGQTPHLHAEVEHKPLRGAAVLRVGQPAVVQGAVIEEILGVADASAFGGAQHHLWIVHCRVPLNRKRQRFVAVLRLELHRRVDFKREVHLLLSRQLLRNGSRHLPSLPTAVSANGGVGARTRHQRRHHVAFPSKVGTQLCRALAGHRAMTLLVDEAHIDMRLTRAQVRGWRVDRKLHVVLHIDLRLCRVSRARRHGL